MKIVIIGAGAMGCLYGAYLSRKHEVIMLDSFKPQVDSINSHGITVLEETGIEEHFSNIKAYLSGEYTEVAKKNIIIGTSKHNSVNMGDAKVRHSGHGVTTIGSNLKENSNLAKIKDVLEECNFTAEVTDDRGFLEYE